MKKSILSLGMIGLAVSSLASAMVTIEPTSPTKNYTPSNIDQYTANRAWSLIQKSPKERSICSNRAMTWSWDMKQRLGIDSEKYFIHYTPVLRLVGDDDGKYKRLRFCGLGINCNTWVYHVAPAVMVEGRKMIFDKQFMNSPVSPKAWEQNFVNRTYTKLNNPSMRAEIISNLRKNIRNYNSRHYKHRTSQAALELIRRSRNTDGSYSVNCKQITHVAEHDLDQFDSWCHMQYASMYYWHPNGLRQLNNGSTYMINHNTYTNEGVREGMRYERNDFFMGEVEQSIKQAFPGRRGL